MKMTLLAGCLLIFTTAALSQTEEKNGTIYIEHPYINLVLKAAKAYEANDVATNKTIYSDTAKFWISYMDKPVSITDAYKMWGNDFKFYDSIKVTPFGYPDYLHYDLKDSKFVQSWWRWSGKSKKTGKVLTVVYFELDRFNDAGKIDREALYGDFSQVEQ